MTDRNEKYQFTQPNIEVGSLHIGRITTQTGCDKVNDKLSRRELVGQIHPRSNLFDLNVDDFWICVRDSGELFSIILGVRDNT